MWLLMEKVVLGEFEIAAQPKPGLIHGSAPQHVQVNRVVFLPHNRGHASLGQWDWSFSLHVPLVPHVDVQPCEAVDVVARPVVGVLHRGSSLFAEVRHV